MFKRSICFIVFLFFCSSVWSQIDLPKKYFCDCSFEQSFEFQVFPVSQERKFDCPCEIIQTIYPCWAKNKIKFSVSESSIDYLSLLSRFSGVTKSSYLIFSDDSSSISQSLYGKATLIIELLDPSDKTFNFGVPVEVKLGMDGVEKLMLEYSFDDQLYFGENPLFQEYWGSPFSESIFY